MFDSNDGVGVEPPGARTLSLMPRGRAQLVVCTQAKESKLRSYAHRTLNSSCMSTTSIGNVAAQRSREQIG